MSSLRSEPQVQARVCHQRLQCQLCRWAPWGVTRELLKEGIITLPAGPSLDTLDYWTDVVQKMTQFPSLSDFVHGAYLNQGTGGVVNNGFWTWAPHEIAKRMANFDNWRCARIVAFGEASREGFLHAGNFVEFLLGGADCLFYSISPPQQKLKRYPPATAGLIPHRGSPPLGLPS